MRETEDALPAEISAVLLERFERLTPAQRLAGLTPAQRLAGLTPAQRLAGLTHDEIVQAFNALPEEIRQQVHRLLRG